MRGERILVSHPQAQFGLGTVLGAQVAGWGRAPKWTLQMLYITVICTSSLMVEHCQEVDETSLFVFSLFKPESRLSNEDQGLGDFLGFGLTRRSCLLKSH